MFKLTLQRKMLLSLGAFIFLFVGIALFIIRSVILQNFLKLEEDESIKGIERTKSVFDQQIHNLESKLSDWAVWDDTYKFLKDGNQQYIDSNLKGESLTNLEINRMYFVATSGAMIFNQGVSAGKEALSQEENKAFLNKLNNEYLIDQDIAINKKGSVFSSPSGPILFASSPVVKSDGSGPAVGTLIFIRKYDKSLSDYFQRINNNNRVNFLPIDDKFLGSANNKKIYESLLRSNYYTSPLSTDEVAGYALILDFKNDPIYIMQNIRPRQIFNHALTTVNNYIYYSALVSLAGVIFGLFLINKFVLSKIDKLNNNVNLIREKDSFRERLDVNGNDEFASLASNINLMLEELSRSDDQLLMFKLAVENAYEHILITDADGKIIYANKAVEMMTGYQRSEIMGKTPRVWGGQMDGAFYHDMWDTLKNKRKVFYAEITNRRKSGELYISQLSATPILDINNNVRFFVAIERDITHQKQEKEIIERTVKERTDALSKARDEISRGWMQIQREKARLSSSIGSLPLGFLMLDTEMNMLMSNPILEKIMGFENRIWNLDDVAKGISQDGNILKVYIENCMKNKKTAYINDILFGAKHLKIVIAPINASSSEILGAVVLVDDITEAKVLERSRDEFFSIASHELRTPLTSIKGNTSMIKDYFGDKIQDPQLKEMIDDIHESSVRLIAIVNDFLDMSRLEQGRIEFKIETFDIVPVIEKIVFDIEKLAKEKNIYLNFTKGNVGSSQMVKADSSRAKQIIYNLLGNSIKFTAIGGVTISVDVDDKYCYIRVIDTGQGIPLSSQSLLFRKFQQAENNILTRDSTKGTGLGLYISKLMADGMGGSLGLESSEENNGSTFLLKIPLA